MDNKELISYLGEIKERVELIVTEDGDGEERKLLVLGNLEGVIHVLSLQEKNKKNA